MISRTNRLMKFVRKDEMFVVAHEMVHQYQWDILSNDREDQGLPPIMSHGPSFFAWREPLAEYNIPLSTKL